MQGRSDTCAKHESDTGSEISRNRLTDGRGRSDERRVDRGGGVVTDDTRGHRAVPAHLKNHFFIDLVEFRLQLTINVLCGERKNGDDRHTKLPADKNTQEAQVREKNKNHFAHDRGCSTPQKHTQNMTTSMDPFGQSSRQKTTERNDRETRTDTRAPGCGRGSNTAHPPCDTQPLRSHVLGSIPARGGIIGAYFLCRSSAGVYVEPVSPKLSGATAVDNPRQSLWSQGCNGGKSKSPLRLGVVGCWGRVGVYFAAVSPRRPRGWWWGSRRRTRRCRGWYRTRAPRKRRKTAAMQRTGGRGTQR